MGMALAIGCGIPIAQYASGYSAFASLKTSISTAVFSRASVHGVIDCYGSWKPAKSGEARFYGARRIENLCTNSEDFATGWGQGIASTGGSVAGVISTRTGRASIKTNTKASGNNGTINITLSSRAYRPAQHTFSVALATNTGTDTVRIRIERSSDSATVAQVDVVPPLWDGTAASMRVYAAFGDITDTTNHRVTLMNTSANVSITYLDGALMENTHGNGTGAPNEYVSIGVLSSPWNGANVDGVQYKDTYNGNSVSSGLVTFATGAAIPDASLLGLMVERGTQNGHFDSRDFSPTTWTKYQVTAGALADSVTLGKNSIRKMEEDTNNNSHRIGQSWRGSAPTDNTRMTVSCYVKKAERDIVRAGFIAKSGTVKLAYFNLTTGVVSNLTGGSDVEAFMYQDGDLWRICVSASCESGATNIESVFGLTTTAGTPSYTGTLGYGAWFGGFQFEPTFMPTAYHGDTATAATLTTLDDNAYLPASLVPANAWEIGCDFTPFYNSNSINKPTWVYVWYARTDVNNRHGLALRPGTYGGFNDAGADDWVYDLYNGDDETTWDGVDNTWGNENAAPKQTKQCVLQMWPWASHRTSNLMGRIGNSVMDLTVSGQHNVNTTPTTTAIRFGINDPVLSNTGVRHSFAVKNFYIKRNPTDQETGDPMADITKSQLSSFPPTLRGAGSRIRITDLKNAEFTSDGTYWKPRNGRATLYHRQGDLATPLATMTGNGAAQTFTLPETLVIPTPLITPNTKVYAEVVVKRGGAAQAYTMVACLGTANTAVSDPSFIGQTLAATDGNETRLFGAAQFDATTTEFVSMGSLVPNSTTTANQVLKNTNINTAADMYVSIGCSNTTLISPDTAKLISYHVWLEG